ncbi:MAG: hypothetical protein O2971_10765 [Proteobacteria bacterium]|nr:hypothetical protein [Pseudomonadota bacterium]
MSETHGSSSSTSLIKFLGLIIIGHLPQMSLAQDDFFNTLNVNVDNRTDSPYSLIGWVTEKVSLGLDDPGPLFSRRTSELNKIETSFFAQFDARLNDNTAFRFSGKAYHDAIYSVQDDTVFARDELNEFRSRFEVKDFYLEYKANNSTYFKVGNQILAWGLAEYLRVTDLINTEDQYTFGQQDLEDLRLQVPAVLVNFTIADWSFDSVVTFNAGRDDMAPAGDEFDQLIVLRNSGMTLLRERPDKQQEVFLRASTRLPSGDFQFVAGEFNDNELSVDGISALRSISPRVAYTQNRMRAAGMAANWVEGSWLFFGELGLHADKAVRPNKDSFLRQVNGWDQKDQLLSVLGLEYNGFQNLLLSFELDNAYTSKHDEFMLADRNQLGYGARLNWTALNERLQVLGVWNDRGDKLGRIARLSVDYSYSDNLVLGLLWVDYSVKEESIFYDFRNNDVLQLQLRYNFQI